MFKMSKRSYATQFFFECVNVHYLAERKKPCKLHIHCFEHIFPQSCQISFHQQRCCSLDWACLRIIR